MLSRRNLKHNNPKRFLEEINSIPDILSYIQSKTRLTRDTICRILIESGRIDDIFVNPQQFMDKVCSEINTVLKEMIVDGIKVRENRRVLSGSRCFLMIKNFMAISMTCLK